MGMQEYSVRLMASESNPVTAEKILRDLERLGYRRSAPSAEVEGAILSKPPRDEFRLSEETQDYIIEALVKTNRDENTLRYVSLRFAVCQPESVISRFQEVVQSLAHEYRLLISDGQTVFSAGDKELSKVIKTDVLARRRRWQQIFEGDDEVRKISVGKAWDYFRDKHPHLRKETAVSA